MQFQLADYDALVLNDDSLPAAIPPFSMFETDQFLTGIFLYFDVSGSSAGVKGELTGGGANPVPVPGAIWLLGSGIAGIAALRRRKKNSTLIFYKFAALTNRQLI